MVAASHLTDANFITSGQYLTIPVNCSCGNPAVSSGHYIFLTFVVEGGTGGNLSGIASQFNSSVDLMRSFNPGVVWDNSQPTQYAFIPLPGKNNVAFVAVAENHILCDLFTVIETVHNDFNESFVGSFSHSGQVV